MSLLVDKSSSFWVSAVGIEVFAFSFLLSSPLWVAVFGFSAGLLASDVAAKVSPVFGSLLATVSPATASVLAAAVLFGLFVAAVKLGFSRRLKLPNRLVVCLVEM
jgi:hypothetical protein